MVHASERAGTGLCEDGCGVMGPAYVGNAGSATECVSGRCCWRLHRRNTYWFRLYEEDVLTTHATSTGGCCESQRDSELRQDSAEFMEAPEKSVKQPRSVRRGGRAT